MAEALGVKNTRITKLERGPDKAGLAAIEKYCAVCEIPVWEAFYISSYINGDAPEQPKLSLRSKVIIAKHRLLSGKG